VRQNCGSSTEFGAQVILFNGCGNREQDQTRYKAHEGFSVGLRDSKGTSSSSGRLYIRKLYRTTFFI